MQPEVIDPNNPQEQGRPEVVKQELQKVADDVKKNFISMAELLYEVVSNQYHLDYGYSNFHDFAASLDLAPRKADWFVQIARTIHRLGVLWADVEEIGWRKTGVICRVLDANNYKEWLKEAEQDSLPVLEEKVKAALDGKKESETPVKLNLQLQEEENSIVETALEKAMNLANVKTKGSAVARICYDWTQMQTDEGVSYE